MAVDYYDQALAKHHWADKHIEKLQTALAEFKQANTNIIMPKQDVDTREVTYYVAHVPNIPHAIPLIAGDALNCLRSALDYVACGMVVAGGNKITSKTKFPIRQSADDWEGAAPGLINGVREAAFEALRRIRPYEGGNELLWFLHRLNNIDKHRLLLAVSLVPSGKTLLPSQVAGFVADNPGGFWRGNSYFHSGSKQPVPLYQGQELLTVQMPDAEYKVHFSLNVAFGETGLAPGTPIELLLRLISSEVVCTVRDLSPYLPRLV